MKSMDNKIKFMLLAIQKDNFEEFQTYFEEYQKHYESQPTAISSDIINSLRRNSSEDSAIHIAAQHGRLSILRYLVEKHGACVNLRNNNRKTPLHDAAQFSKFEVVEYLINQGADVNALKNADWTPLMLACTKLRPDIVKILLRNGADPLFKNKDGWNSFHIASREGSVEILQLLVSNLREPTVERLDQLVNSKSKNGRKPLHTAALHGRIAVVDYILQNNFTSADDIDNCGTTALMDAVRSGSTELFDKLVQYGAEITRHNKTGYNCLHIAAEVGVSDVISHLVLNYNFEINALTEPGSLTALQIAIKEKHCLSVKTLERLAENYIDLTAS